MEFGCKTRGATCTFIEKAIQCSLKSIQWLLQNIQTPSFNQTNIIAQKDIEYI